VKIDDTIQTLARIRQSSHKRVDTKSVSSIAKHMIDYAIDYLGEIKASVKESTGVSETR
jgi:hypothetical protein